MSGQRMKGTKGVSTAGDTSKLSELIIITSSTTTFIYQILLAFYQVNNSQNITRAMLRQ